MANKLINVRVVARAKQEKIIIFGDGLKVYLKKPPLNGKANKRLREILADYFKLKKRQITIIKGTTSRNKTVSLDVSN